MASSRRGGVTIRDVDHGYQALLHRVYGLAERPSIAVGILSGDVDTAYEDGTTVLDVGIFNEFGTVDANGQTHVPARPFIRGWFDENRAQAQRMLTRLLRQVVAGTLTEEQALNQFGAWCVGGIQQRMSAGIPPPNADSTIEKKGSSTPLIDNGILRSSVSYEIRR